MNNYKKEHEEENIFYAILFFLSNSVKTKEEFLLKRNNPIDFKVTKFNKLIDDYFKENKPLAYILGHTSFLGLDIQVKDKILYPRAETEIVVTKSIEYIRQNENIKSICDLCSGSGNIALAIKKEFPNISAYGIDINPKATKLAKLNAKNNNLDVTFLTGDFLKKVVKNNLKFDCIISNPPYVDKAELNEQMTKWENKISFSNSEDSLFFYKEIITNYKVYAKDENNFLMCFEIGYNQKQKLSDFLEEKKLLKYTTFYEDFSGLDRILIIGIKR